MTKKFSIQNINVEPWVDLPSSKFLQNWQRKNEIEFNQKNRQIEKYKMFMKVFDFLNANGIEGDYFEFGCHRCRTFRMVMSLAYLHFNKKMHFFAFDSFQGLPKPKNKVSVSHWQKSSLKTTEVQFLKLIKETGYKTDNVHIIKGFYDKSLSRDLIKNFKNQDIKCKLVNIDCDLYESAVPVFKFLDSFLIEGSIIYLDDYYVGNNGNINYGIPRAFEEYKKISNWTFTEHMQVSWWGKTFIASPRIKSNKKSL